MKSGRPAPNATRRLTRESPELALEPDQRFALPDRDLLDLADEHGMVTRLIRGNQEKVERHNFDIRKQLLEYDDVMNQQRTVVYEYRHAVLEGSNMLTLLIKEMMVRGDLERCLIISPGSLTDQWQDELSEKFGLDFEILTTDMIHAARTANPFDQKDFVSARMDQLSRNEDIQEKLKAAPEWDLVVVDEAHRMSGHVFGTEIKLTSRLADEFPEKNIFALSGDNCPLCVNMFRTSLEDLVDCLDALGTGPHTQEITVRPDIARDAKRALDRMLELQ